MLDLDAIEAALASSKPKRRMRGVLPALIAELRAARAVVAAAERLLADAESQSAGWGPDITMQWTLSAALADYRIVMEGAP